MGLVLLAWSASACGTSGDVESSTPATTTHTLVAALRARIGVDGAELTGSKGSTRFVTRGIGRLGTADIMSSPTLATGVREEGGRVTIERALDGEAGRISVREWWTTAGGQLELGYDIAARPDGDGDLAVVVAVSGDGTLQVSADGAAAFVDDPAGPYFAPRVELLDLRVRDGGGRALPSRFELRKGDLAIVVDDRGARYPITIDPVVASGIETKISAGPPAVPGWASRVAISADGNHLLVKNPTSSSPVEFYDYGASGWGFSGAVGFPPKTGTSDSFGTFGDAIAFASDGNALVTSYRYNNGSSAWEGAFFVFDTTRTYAKTIQPTDNIHDNQFGYSMATSGNDIIVGARSTSGSAAGAYVFTHPTATSYVQQAKLAQPAGATYFGWAVAISANLAAVGTDANKAYAFRRTGTTWGAAKAIAPTDLAAGDGLGFAMAIGGTTLLYPAPGKKLTADNDGQVYVYKDTGTDVVADGVMFTAPPAGATGGNLGSSIAISPDGNTAYVGAPSAVGGQGRVYVMVRAGAAWSLTRTLVPSDPTTAGFGSSVVLAGTRLAVTAPSGATEGFVYLYDPVLGAAPAAKCTRDVDCASGHCADGVCCDSICTGQCEACNLAGKAGTCSPVSGSPVGSRATCPSTGSGVCASTCDGVTRASCTMPGLAKSCGAASCDATGKAVGLGHCDGAGACTSPVSVSCAPYLCNAGACPTTCRLDTECVDGARCVTGACVEGSADAGPKTNGVFTKCTNDAECATGHCSDGVCCDVACKDKCSSCIVPGSIGLCVTESGVDLRNECDAAACVTTCQGGGCRPIRSGDQCAPSACVDDHTAQGPSTCSAAGSKCAPSTGTLDCGLYVCALGACLTSCVDSSRCVAGAVCDESQHCIPVVSSDSGGGCVLGTSSNHSAEGATIAIGVLALVGLVRRKRATR